MKGIRIATCKFPECSKVRHRSTDERNRSRLASRSDGRKGAEIFNKLADI